MDIVWIISQVQFRYQNAVDPKVTKYQIADHFSKCVDFDDLQIDPGNRSEYFFAVVRFAAHYNKQKVVLIPVCTSPGPKAVNALVQDWS